MLTAWLAAARAGSARAASDVAETLPRDTPLHLVDALARARAHNADVLAAASDERIAQANLRTARQHPDPAVSGQTSRIHLDRIGDGTAIGNDLWSRSYDSVLQLSQTLEVANKRGLRRRVAAAAIDEARARRLDVERRIEADVTAAYAAAGLAEANVRIARASASYLRDEARIAEVRWHAGDISATDLDQIEIAAARLELDAEAAEAGARAERVALETLMGSPSPTGDFTVADSLPALAEAARARTPEQESGLRPDVAAARAEQQRTDWAWRLERTQRLPDPTLVLQVEHQPPDRASSFGVGVALPLPLWNRDGGAIAAARATREQAAHAAKAVEAAATAETVAARAQLEEATRRWLRYREELAPRSDAIRLGVSLAYEKGGASLLDLLAAQRNDNEVRLATMQAASDVVTAAARLSAATTTIQPEVTRP